MENTLEQATEQPATDAGFQLLVFEKKSDRSGWKYLGSYKAGNQEELTASENTIRKTHAALHAQDGVRWAVVASEGNVNSLINGFTSVTGRGRNRKLKPNALASLDGLGAIVIELPELPAPVEWTAEQILQREG